MCSSPVHRLTPRSSSSSVAPARARRSGPVSPRTAILFETQADLAAALYSIAQGKKQYPASFHDITVGNNDVAEIGGGFDTSTGWDPVTGLGSPNAANLLPLLAQRTA